MHPAARSALSAAQDRAADATEAALVDFMLRRERRPDLTAAEFAAALPESERATFLEEARAVLATSERLTTDMRLPTRVGRHRIVGLLGEGGTARVFAARSIPDDRPVAIKVLHAHLAHHARSRARLRREASLATRLRHPRIAVVHECGDEDGRLYLVMDAVDGSPLHRVLRGRTAPWLEDHRAIARSFAALAEGLHAAHERGIVHRDVKPANIMLGADGALTILDFGLATSPEGHLTCTSDFLGTPAYMSPEQASAEHAAVGPASDIYALGAVLYECLTARPAVASGALPRVLDAIRAGRIPAPHRIAAVDLSLSRIVQRCLQRRPGARYQDAAALAADLRDFAAGERPRTIAGGAWLRRACCAGLLVAASACVALALPPRTIRDAAPPSVGAPIVGTPVAVPRQLFDLARRGDEANFTLELRRIIRAEQSRLAESR